MDQGHLELTLPGGERRYYETLDSGLSARLHIRKPDFFKKRGSFQQYRIWGILCGRRLGFDETFFGKCNYYLRYCEAAFAIRNTHVMQMLYMGMNNTRSR